MQDWKSVELGEWKIGLGRVVDWKSVELEECRIGGVQDWKCVRVKECKNESVQDWKSVQLEVSDQKGVGLECVILWITSDL